MLRPGVLVLLATGIVPGLAYAQATPERVRLRYTAPAECPDDLELAQQIEELLGQSLREVREHALAVDVRVQGGKNTGYSAKLSFAGAQGTQDRYVDHPECGKLIEAGALMIAIAIDPERVRSRQGGGATSDDARSKAGPVVAPVAAAAPTASLASHQSPPAISEAKRDASPVVPRPSTEPLRTTVALHGVTSSGVMPRLAPGIGAELAFGLGPVEAGVGGRYWVPQQATVPTAGSSSIDVALVTAGLRLCGVPKLEHWALPVCLRGELGDMEATGQDVSNARTRHALFASFGGGAMVAYTRHRLIPLAGFDLQWAAARPRFGLLRSGQEVEGFQPDTAALNGFVGIAYAL